MSRQRIYIDARNIQATPTGVGSYATALIPELVAQAPEAWEWVIIRHESNRTPLMQDRSGFHEVFVDQRIGLLDDFLLGAGTIHRVFRALGPPSIYHNLFHVTPLFMGHLGAYTPRHVVTLHDLIWIEHAFSVKTRLEKALFFKAYGRMAIPHTLHAADRVICVSEATRARALRWASDPEHFVTIPHGVAPAFFDEQPWPESLMGAREDAPPYIVAVGNDKPYKNLATLARAFARAHDMLDGARLVLVGGCQGLMPLIRELGIAQHVVLPGFLEDEALRSLMAHARLFVFPSLVEGFGLPPLEAMASGVPCAVSDREPMRGVVGDAAVRFDPLDVGELSRVITRVMTRDDVARKLAARGRERARTFRWERAASRTLDVYRDVLEHCERGR